MNEERIYQINGASIAQANAATEAMTYAEAAYCIRMAASSLFPELGASREQEIMIARKTDTDRGPVYTIHFSPVQK